MNDDVARTGGPAGARARRTVLFGGAFDPVHVGHTLAVTALLDAGDVARVVMVPTGPRSDKAARASGRDRVEMARIMVRECFGGEGRVSVRASEAADAERGAVRGTADLWDDVTAEEPGTRFVVAVGADVAGSLGGWIRAEYVRRNVAFLLLERGGVAPAPPPAGYDAETIRPPFGATVSSSLVRERLRRGLCTSGLIATGVARYVRDKGLYIEEAGAGRPVSVGPDTGMPDPGVSNSGET